MSDVVIEFRCNAGIQHRITIDPSNDEDLRYFWRRFQTLANRFAQRNTQGAGIFEVTAVQTEKEFYMG